MACGFGTLDEDLILPDLAHRFGSGLGAIDDYESSVRGRQAAGDEILQSGHDHGVVFCRSFDQAQDAVVAVGIHPSGADH